MTSSAKNSRKRPRTSTSTTTTTATNTIRRHAAASSDPGASTEQSSSSTTTTTTTTASSIPPPPPRVLTRAVIPTLAVTALDASDALELYYLTRPTVLHAFGNAIPVLKVALGLRYRPRSSTTSSTSSSSSAAAAAEHHAVHKPLELTLEYGAARAGDDLWHESLPRVGVGDDNHDNADTPEDIWVTWDNEAKVYYTERIDQHIYTTANYLASLSGTVTTKFLQSAVDLLLRQEDSGSGGTNNNNNNSNRQRQRRRPPHGRYQPLSVAVLMDNNNNNNSPPGSAGSTTTPTTVLRSSSDVDFLQELYHVLAELGVELQPVIVPQQSHVVLHAVGGITKVAVGVDVAPHEPALFYQTLYKCIQSIVTADGSAYNNNNNNNIAAAASSNNNTNTTEANSNNNNNNATPPRRRDIMLDPPPEASLPVESLSPTPDTTTTTTTAPIATTLAPTGANVAEPPTPPPAVDTNNNNNNNMDLPPDHTTQAQEAATAAQQAQQAAAEANTPETAQAAAQAAASAAQQAAHITTQQAATMAQQALTSGDATAMLYTISRMCLHDPLYGLATAPVPTTMTNTTTNSTVASSSSSSSSNSNNSVTAYIYWDGAFYYRVNLVPPYLSIRTEAQILPPPPVAGISREDVVDWAIFVGLVMMTVLGFLLLLQQICGVRLGLPKLYHYQRWFFQPRQYSLESESANGDDDDDNDDDDADDADRYGNPQQQHLRRRGRGNAFPFVQDAIPLSMGGQSRANVLRNHWDDYSPWWRQRQYSDLSGTSHNNNNDITDHHANNDSHNDYDESESEHETFLGDFGGDLELVAPTSTGVAEPGSSNHDGGINGDSAPQPVPSSRLFRDPNLVDLPDLTSSSKVAVPVSIALQSSH